jgi:enoyl-CoA hydratase/carnithine racemase
VIGWEARHLVGVATIDRQERRNALNAGLCHDLRSRLESAGELRVVVITGAGTAFCSGADLVTRFEGDDRSAEDTLRPEFELLMDTIEAFPGPVIAAVNGPAFGAGMQMAWRATSAWSRPRPSSPSRRRASVSSSAPQTSSGSRWWSGRRWREIS